LTTPAVQLKSPKLPNHPKSTYSVLYFLEPIRMKYSFGGKQQRKTMKQQVKWIRKWHLLVHHWQSLISKPEFK
jgi:hypothetical protein